MNRNTYIICAIILGLIGTGINYSMVNGGNSGSRGYGSSYGGYGGYGGFSGGHK